MKFRLESTYKPSGDQPGAIEGLCEALSQGVGDVTLLGVTGSGKTFTMANVIERLQRPALILSHNKTLAAQLYGEFKSFFPSNAVEYFVSYYDYYQPEAYLPTTDTYIEKDLSINDQIDKLRLSAASALMSGRRDVIVVSSVSCLYGIGNPEDFHAQSILVKRGEQRSLTRLLYHLVDANYSRTEVDFKRGTFRVRGDTVDVFLGGSDEAGGLANHTGFMLCTVHNKGETINDTLINVMRSTKKSKRDKYMGLYSLPLLKLAYTILPFSISEFSIKIGYDNPLIGMSNIGLLPVDKLTFGNAKPVDGFMTGAVKYKPFMQLALTTLNDVVTMTIAIRGNDDDKKIVEKFFDLIVENVKEFDRLNAR